MFGLLLLLARTGTRYLKIPSLESTKVKANSVGVTRVRLGRLRSKLEAYSWRRTDNRKGPGSE